MFSMVLCQLLLLYLLVYKHKCNLILNTECRNWNFSISHKINVEHVKMLESKGATHRVVGKAQFQTWAHSCFSRLFTSGSGKTRSFLICLLHKRSLVWKTEISEHYKRMYIKTPRTRIFLNCLFSLIANIIFKNLQNQLQKSSINKTNDVPHETSQSCLHVTEMNAISV